MGAQQEPPASVPWDKERARALDRIYQAGIFIGYPPDGGEDGHEVRTVPASKPVQESPPPVRLGPIPQVTLPPMTPVDAAEAAHIRGLIRQLAEVGVKRR